MFLSPLTGSPFRPAAAAVLPPSLLAGTKILFIAILMLFVRENKIRVQKKNLERAGRLSVVVLIDKKNGPKYNAKYTA